MRFLRVLLPSVAALLVGFQASAQAVISAHSGVVHFSEGSVFIDDQPLDHKFATYPNIKEGSTLRTEKGRAEILLTPGMFLRVDENSAIRMRSNSLADTRVEFLHGSILLDSVDALGDNHVAITYRDTEVRFPKQGIYRLDYETGTLQAYSGEAEVQHDGKTSKIDDSHLYFFTLDLDTKKLGDGTDDEFYDWARERSDAISAENQLSAQTSGDPGDVDSSDPNGPGASPNFGIPSAGIPSPGIPSAGIPSIGIPSYPTLGYNYPFDSVFNPFSPYGMGWPGYPFSSFPVFVVVPGYRYWNGHHTGSKGVTAGSHTSPSVPFRNPMWPRTNPNWPRSSTLVTPRSSPSGLHRGTGYLPSSTGLSRVPPVRPLYVAPRPVPSVGVRPGYSHVGVTAPRVAAPAGVHAIGHR
jgi:hypothetical protein